MEIKILDTRITPVMLKPATPGSAAIDLYACIDETIVIKPMDSMKIETGIAINLNHDHMKLAGLIAPRSGLGSKGLVLGNLIGVVDQDYTGQIIACMWNRSYYDSFSIRPMDRIAQLFVVPVADWNNFIVVDEFSVQTERGDNGFGSSGR